MTRGFQQLTFAFAQKRVSSSLEKLTMPRTPEVCLPAFCPLFHFSNTVSRVLDFPALPSGNCIVKAEYEGFTPTDARDVVLNVNDRVALTIQLKVGSLKGQTVDIVDSPPLIDESPAVGTTVDRQFVGNLPLNGRSFQS